MLSLAESEKPEFSAVQMARLVGKELECGPRSLAGCGQQQNVFSKSVWLYIPEFKVTLG